jgi:hypothetical protein
MSQKANYFRLGIFILVAAAILVAIVLALGAGNIFKRTVTIETYFDESVQGLDVGSAVKYRGVQIGRVTRIGFTGSTYQRDVPMKSRRQYVLVEAELQPALIGTREGDAESGWSDRRTARLPVGITGTAYLVIDSRDRGESPLTSLRGAASTSRRRRAPTTRS